MSGFGFRCVSRFNVLSGGWNNIVLKCLGLLNCKYWLEVKIIFIWLCFIGGVVVLIICNLFDIFKCKIIVFIEVLISRYLVCCFIVEIEWFIMLVIVLGMGYCICCLCIMILVMVWF